LPAQFEILLRTRNRFPTEKLRQQAQEQMAFDWHLKEQQFYSNPNVALREQNSRADLNKTRDDIAAKKVDVEKDQTAITGLEDQLRQAGGNPGWSRTP